MKVLAILLGIFGLFGAYYAFFTEGQDVRDFEYNFFEEAMINDRRFLLATVDTPDLMQKGLSNHRALTQEEPFEGLLFVFPNSGAYGIWMKDMLFPIDVLWLDEELKVVYIKTQFLPESYPEVVRPNVPAWYVLEVAGGTVEDTEIKIGDTLEIQNEKANDG